MCRRGEDVLRTTGLGYTIVRPGPLLEEPGGYKALVFDQGNRITESISIADVADVALKVNGLRCSACGRVAFMSGTKPLAAFASACQLKTMHGACHRLSPLVTTARCVGYHCEDYRRHWSTLIMRTAAIRARL